MAENGKLIALLGAVFFTVVLPGVIVAGVIGSRRRKKGADRDE